MFKSWVWRWFHPKLSAPKVISPQSNAKFAPKTQENWKSQETGTIEEGKNSLFLLKEVFKWCLKTCLGRNKKKLDFGMIFFVVQANIILHQSFFMI